MADSRVALKNKTRLTFFNAENGRRTYTVQREISRGASCIVYDASYENHSGAIKPVRIKECYPFRLSIRRAENGDLIPAENDRNSFLEAIAQMVQAFDLGNELFSKTGLTNFISNTVDLYEWNQTVYIVTVYQEGETLSERHYETLKDCISVVKSTAKVIADIHNHGYLYLDLKPENIFSLRGTNDIVQIFDFDSLIPLTALTKDEADETYRISYTKGYSALELKTGSLKRIGKYSDIYGIGAVLFSLIFGRTPEAPDCGLDAEYDFSSFKFASETFQDKLYLELTEFFHNTLANYYLDRYQDMRQTVGQLEKLEMLADTETPYVCSTYVPGPRLFVGREQEMNKLVAWFADEASRCLVISGMGGIGKSTFLYAYLSEHIREFDTVLILNVQESIVRTVADDRQFLIHGVERIKQETDEEYFERKLRTARGLLHEKRVVLVLDNFDGDFNGVNELLCVDWKIVLITRGSLCPDGFSQIRIGALANREEIHTFFEGYLRRQLEETEYPLVDRIAELVAGHTLVLELIAKQIAYSYLSIKEALSLIEKNGFSGMAWEKVDVTRNAALTVDTVKNIIQDVFQAVHMTQKKRNILKVISCFGVMDVPVRIFSELCELASKDALNELACESWLRIENGTIWMHPVIVETVSGWEMCAPVRQLAEKIMVRLRERVSKIARTDNAEKTDIETCFVLAEKFLDGYQKLEGENISESYYRLLFDVVCRMPRYREEYILEKSKELLAADADTGRTALAKTLSGEIVSVQNFLVDTERLKLLHFVTEIYEERRDFAQAYEALCKAGKRFEKHHDYYIRGKYYELWMDYYDFKLDGHYQAFTTQDKQISHQLMSVTDKAIRCMKQSSHSGSRVCLGEYLRCKANFLIRSNPEQKKRIGRLLDKVKDILDEKNHGDGELLRNYCLTLAWFYTYVEPDYAEAVKCLQQANEVEDVLCDNMLDLIDEIYVPTANILFEWGECELAARLLSHGIEVCAEKEEVIPYARKGKELEKYLQDVLNH